MAKRAISIAVEKKYVTVAMTKHHRERNVKTRKYTKNFL